MDWIKEFLKGIIIGVANIIPGVSGGTMAVSVGVYDKLILAVTGLRKDWKKSVLTLLPYIIGAVAGIGALSFIVRYTLVHYPLQTSGLFMGLIVGGIPVIMRRIEKSKIGFSNIAILILFFAAVVAMTFLNVSEGATATDIPVHTGTVFLLFFIGMVAAATMIIPGVSGSLVLMVLGFYGIVVSNISHFFEALFSFDVPGIIHGAGVLIPLGLGIVFGIFIIAKLIEVLFQKAPVPTYCAILGLIFGSPIAVLYKTEIMQIDAIAVITALVLFAAGFCISFFLGKDS